MAEPTGSVWYWFASRSPEDDPGPQAQAAEVQECDADADRQPDDRRDRAGELQLVPDLRRGVVGARERADEQDVPHAGVVREPPREGSLRRGSLER